MRVSRVLLPVLRALRWHAAALAVLISLLVTGDALAQQGDDVGDPVNLDASGLIQLGPGDSIRLAVYGQASMTTTIYVGDDGKINVPLVGFVSVAGMSPVEAGKAVEVALKNGGYFNDPHVTIAVLQSRSQRVAVLGKVHHPGRYTIDPKTTIYDLVAQAGGTAEDGADFGYVLRADGQGGTQRFRVSLGDSPTRSDAPAVQSLRGGDTLVVPRAEQFYIYGEVAAANMYRLEHGMTVLQAVARAGGITERGSERRIDIKRADKNGRYAIFRAKLSDTVRPNDVIHVKESIF
jgi:polysaccharide biosynthesis/export protein